MTTDLGQPALRLSDTSMVSVALKLSNNDASAAHNGTTVHSHMNKLNDALYDNRSDSITVNRLDQVDSEDIPASDEMRMNDNDDGESGNSNTPFLRQLLSRMNPKECLSPTIVNAAQSSIVTAVQGCTTTAYTTCLAGDREEFESVLQDLLKNIKYKSTSSSTTISKSSARTAALQRLYRLTDREHAHNRYDKIQNVLIFLLGQ